MKRHSIALNAGLFFGTSAILLLLIGCAAVGPDYTPPASRAPAAWSTPLESGLSDGRPGRADLARWWQGFADPILTGLIETAAAENLDVAQAKARLREARARWGGSRADQYPTVDASGAATRSLTGANTGSGRETRLYDLGFDAGWEIDIFGGVRRSIEASRSDLEAARADLDDTMVTLAAEIGRNYVEARTYQNRLHVARANYAIQQETYDLIRSRWQAGIADALELQQARYNLEATGSQIPFLISGLEAVFNRLAVLTGQPPGSLDALLAPDRPVPTVPPTVAVGIPAEALRQRPDIRQAERRLAAETARIGVAEAELYPKLRLAGSIGLRAVNTNDLAEWASRTWSIGPSLSWNLFDAGAIRRNIEAQNAVQEQYLAAYEAAVLAALEEAENALSAYVQQQASCDRLAAAVEAAREAQVLARHKYEAGLADFSDVLDAQRALLSYQDQLASGRGTVTTNLIAIYKALGGGWEPSSAAGS